MNRQFHRGGVLVLVALGTIFAPLALPPPARAASIQKLPLARLLESSALICRATAATVDAGAYDTDTREALSLVTFRIEELVKGDWKPATIEFLVRGGFQPDGGLRWYTLPFFTPGQCLPPLHPRRRLQRQRPG